MFSRKTRPAQCEHLTDAQANLVRKMLKVQYMSPLPGMSEKALRNGWPEVIAAYLNRNGLQKRSIDWVLQPLIFDDVTPEKCTALFMALPAIGRTCLDTQGSYLGTFLIFAHDNAEWQQQAFELVKGVRARGHALYRILRAGDIGKHGHAIDMLFAHDFDMYFDSAALMKCALMNEHFAIADRLMARGFDLHLYSPELNAYVIEKDFSHASRAYLDGLMRKAGVGAVAALPAPPAPTEQESGYTRSGDMVSCSDTLPDGSVLTTVFNFASAQQIIFTRIEQAVSAPVVVPFGAIEERRQLNNAAAAFLAQGGDAALTENISQSARKPIVHKSQEPR